MTLDTRPQVSETATQPVPFIDFDKRPQAIEEYKFGEPVTRNNFAHFLIDSFAKSRGSLDAQTYYMKWLEIHSGTDIPTIIRNFIDKKGLSCLTRAERVIIASAYEKVSSHSSIKVLEAENDQSFSYELSEQLDEVLMIHQNAGKKVFSKLAKTEVNYKEMDEVVLAMEKPDFLHWLATEGKSVSLWNVLP